MVNYSVALFYSLVVVGTVTSMETFYSWFVFGMECKSRAMFLSSDVVSVINHVILTGHK